MNTKLLALYGLKFHPFHADVPTEALYATPAVDAFLRRVELTIADGGFAMLTGDPGTGKTIATRLLADRLRALPNVVVGTIEHPQSRTSDFYRELGDLFGIPLTSTTAGPASRPSAPAGASTSPPPSCAPCSSSTRPRRPSPPSSASCASSPARTSTPDRKSTR